PLGYPTKYANFDLASSLYAFPFSTCAGQPQILIWDKLGFRPIHNSRGVEGTDLEGTKLSR
ncbi:hypothetical protein K8B34_20515, partial [Alteromonas stellipolaris]